MFNNLYTFSKTSWHVRLFKWLYGTDPTQTFNTMCPYFWSMFFTLLPPIFAIILIIKLFGKAGNNFVSKSESYRRDNYEKRKQKFLTKCDDDSLTDEDAYDIKTSKCWGKFSYYLEYDVKSFINEKYRNHRDLLLKQRYIKEDKKSALIKDIKTSKYFPYVAYTITAVILSLIVYTLYLVGSYLNLNFEFDPEGLKTVGTVVGVLAVFCISLFCFIQYILNPFLDYLKCCKLPKLGLFKLIGRPFIFIGKGLYIIGDMIYMTYKKACPRITWRD